MIFNFKQFFLNQWPRKAIAIALAVVIWILINSSITTNRTFTNVGVRVVNLPPGQTIDGLMPDGYLRHKITVNLQGRKWALDNLDPSDLEVVVDARDKKNQWIVKVTKQMLVSPSSQIDLQDNINEVESNDFVLKLTPLVTEKIPIYIARPIGDPPPGYQFLEIWPQILFQTVSGPQEQVERLKANGLELTLNLNRITEKDLLSIAGTDKNQTQDEVSYLIPASWKVIQIPFYDDQKIPINDPSADQLRIDFLRLELIPLNMPLPITIFFPLQYSSLLNPTKCALSHSNWIASQNDLNAFTLPLYARNVSRLFLNIVRDHLQLTIIAMPVTEKEKLDWCIQIVNLRELENNYVAVTHTDMQDNEFRELNPSLRENYLRAKFRSYSRKMELYTDSHTKLELDIEIQGHKVVVKNQK